VRALFCSVLCCSALYDLPPQQDISAIVAPSDSCLACSSAASTGLACEHQEEDGCAAQASVAVTVWRGLCAADGKMCCQLLRNASVHAFWCLQSWCTIMVHMACALLRDWQIAYDPMRSDLTRVLVVALLGYA
jgi:hypothetical protein